MGRDMEYDLDDYGFDQYEFEAEFEDGHLFDKHEGEEEEEEDEEFKGEPGLVDLMELDSGSDFMDEQYAIDSYEFSNVSDEEDFLLSDEYMEEQALYTEILAADIPEHLGFVKQWDKIEGHAVYYEPWYTQYEYDRQQERYYFNIDYERARQRKVRKAAWWRNPEQARLIQRQKNKKHWHSLTPEQRRERKRIEMRKYRAKLKARKEQEQEK